VIITNEVKSISGVVRHCNKELQVKVATRGELQENYVTETKYGIMMSRRSKSLIVDSICAGNYIFIPINKWIDSCV
jgi:hypothetical protein